MVGINGLNFTNGGGTKGPFGLFVMTDPLGNRAIERCCNGGPLPSFPWYGDPTATATLAALQVYAGSLRPGALAGSRSIHLPSPGTFTVPTLPIEPLTISGVTNPPEGCLISRRGRGPGPLRARRCVGARR